VNGVGRVESTVDMEGNSLGMLNVLRRQSISVTLAPDVLQALNAYCNRVGINRSRAIEEFIEHAVNDSHKNVGIDTTDALSD
jgi:hypothetical protein